MITAQRSICQSRYYMVPRIHMTLVGIWPYNTIGIRYLRFVTMLTFSIGIVVPQILYLLNDSTDIDDVFECVPSITIALMFSLKLVNVMIHSEKIKVCFKTIEEDWLSLKTDVEKAILRQYTEYGHRMSLSYALIILVPALFHLLKPVITTLMENDIENITKSSISRASKFPFRVEYGEKLDQYFYLIMIHCCLAVFAHLVATVAVDSFYYTVIQHACGMFSIIGHMLENIGKNDDANLEENNIKDNNYGIALECLRRHLHVLEFAGLIESIFTNMFLFTISCNMVLGSFSGIQVIMNLNGAGNIATPLSVYFAQLTILFLQFWQGQFLLNSNDVPYESICRARWYCTSRKCKKILILIMSRTMLPCKITAGKVVTLSIESFGAVLKTSMSYLMVLRSFQ
ncbi:odorant receptor 13a-like isoform X1 [Camponotus floridanus]|uniref:odorant receptor 13a-like isoform X1 n=2 Tax=Camponotus floridanus TaxID=104421 RepID=UPI000DC6A943|nr:odorant receptor 13a-like isoform X1 [Camponotus floridanus]